MVDVVSGSGEFVLKIKKNAERKLALEKKLKEDKRETDKKRK